MRSDFINSLAEALYRSTEKKSSKENADIVERAVRLLKAKRMLKRVPQLFASLDNVQLAHEGKVRASVTSKHALSPSEKKQLLDYLKNKFRKDIELHEHVDPKCIGGFIVRCGDSIIDATLDTTLKQLSIHLTTKS